MRGLPIFNELFDKTDPDPLEKTAVDGGFHVDALEANKDVDAVILGMSTATAPLYSTFMTDKVAFDKGEGDIKLLNASFDVLENSLKGIFLGYQKTIVGIYLPDTDRYKELFWINVTDMFKVGIATKMSNVSRFLLAVGNDVKLATIKTSLLLKQSEILTKQATRTSLRFKVDALELVARASQKIFCQEEQGNAGTLMNFYKKTPYLCNQYFNVTDIKHYKATEGAKAKKAAHLHEFLQNTITIVSDILLSPSCKTHIKNISMETVKIGTTYAPDVKPRQKHSLDPGKTFKKKIKFIGEESNTLLVVDTTGNTGSVTLEIIVTNVTVKNK